jgi:antimicrobial peptide system SdpA family protein
MHLTVAIAVGYTFILISAGVICVMAALPSNIVWGHGQAPVLRAELNAIAGQNFGFFTRSPESEEADAYRIGQDGAIGASLLVTPQAKTTNLFGVSRTQRAQGPEMANLVHAMPAHGWVDCSLLDRATCFAAIQAQPRVELRNDSPVPTVCGLVALTSESTVKWAYRRLSDTRYVINQGVQAHVLCTYGH